MRYRRDARQRHRFLCPSLEQDVTCDGRGEDDLMRVALAIADAIRVALFEVNQVKVRNPATRSPGSTSSASAIRRRLRRVTFPCPRSMRETNDQ